MGTTLTEQQVRLALEQAKGNRQKAAEDLGVNRVTLWRAMRRFGIAPAWTKDAA
jgi:transcriptional regulator of acetoin/glycerol metabolism